MDRNDFFTVPADLLAALLSQALGETTPDGGRLQEEVSFLKKSIQDERGLRLLSGASPGMRQVRAAIQQVARTDSTVLILGETGTGKELIARAIHQLSPRRSRLLVPVNCAALPHALLPSELFGHEAGAFTGAVKARKGRFELAHQGTLFLDEVGEIPAETQVMLLRVLQDRVIERLGGTQSIAVDVRLIAATHVDLAERVRQARFRSDLFYRLNVFPIEAPPLRARPEDIPDLVQHFIHLFNRKLQKQVAGISARSLQTLAGYSWPGNVRELENIIERAMIVASGETLEIDPRWLAPVAATTAVAATNTLHDAERRMIEQALSRSGGRIYGPQGAAAALGLKPTTLYGKLNKHRIARRNNQK